MMAMTSKTVKAAIIISAFLLSIVAGMQVVNVATGNFLPPPPELPHAYVRNDGSISPQTLPIQRTGDMYILTGDIFNLTLEIQKANIVLDGSGYTMQGNTSGIGLLLNGTSNITIKNLTLTSFRLGMDVEQSSGDIITANIVTNCELGLYLNFAQNIQITHNQVTSNSQTAILFYSFSDHNRIEDNNINSNVNGIWCEFPGSYNGTNDDNSIIGNNITNNGDTAILLRGSANDLIQSNNITGNQYGISLSGSSCNYNTIGQNTLLGNIENNIGISGDSKYNIITQNLIANSKVGIYIFNSNGSQIYFNNFIQNQKQVENDFVLNPDTGNLGPAINFWDKDNQGNYWSDRSSTNATYVIDSLNVDHYPLNMPASVVAVPEFPAWIILSALITGTALYVVLCRKRMKLK